MRLLPGIAVFTKQDGSGAFAAAMHHYDDLVDRLNRNEQGWMELDCAYGEGGKLLIRLEDIVQLELITESCADERNRMADL